LLLSLYYKFTALSAGERTLKIGQFLAKLEAKIVAPSRTRCTVVVTVNHRQLYLAMRVDNTPARLSVLAQCTTDVRQWYLQNGLQLKPDKSKALIIRTQMLACP